MLMGRVRILADSDPPDPLASVRPSTHCRLCCSSNGDDEEDVKVAMDKQGRILSCVRMKPRRKVILLIASIWQKK